MNYVKLGINFEIQPNAYLLGGSKEELIALDHDEDGIND